MRLPLLLVFLSQIAFSQFAPPVGQPGTTAMFKDSAAFVEWANFCMVQRGLQDISNTSGPYATFGDSSKAIGIADGSGLVSLGDGGSAILTFSNSIIDGPGNDFAVFENAFDSSYLEFGFVEVSSDGINFFRFPATSNIQDTAQTGPFSYSSAGKINNLAGKYQVSYGTPFDLAELQGTSGLDLNNVTHVKIIDVVGSIDPAYATYDKNGHKINDPWPTGFASSGFDLDAVGVINQTLNSIEKNSPERIVSVYPNPAVNNITVDIRMNNLNYEVQLINFIGVEVFRASHLSSRTLRIDVSDFPEGIYFLHLKTKERSFTKKIIVGK
jgi:hypothetical protein